MIAFVSLNLLSLMVILSQFDFTYDVDEDLGFRSATYTNSFYFVVTTMTTVGFGDQVPTKSIPMIVSFLMELMGIIIYGYSMQKANSLVKLFRDSNSDHLEEREDFDYWINLREKMSN